MPRQPWLLDIVSDAFRGVRGFRVDAYPGWQNRGSTVFDPDHVMDHHTGPGSYNALLNYMAEGPVHPPLCNIATSRPNNRVVRITIVAAGRANHAGQGDYRSIPTNQGNRRSIGIENQNDGRQDWPAQQVEAMRRLDAALLAHLGKSTNFLLDHKTYAPRRKVDRHTFHVPTERIAVQRYMGADAEPTTDDIEEFLMSLPNDHPLRELADNPTECQRLVDLAENLGSRHGGRRLGEFGSAMADDDEGGTRQNWGRSIFQSAVIGRHRQMQRSGISSDDFALLRGMREGISYMRPGERLDNWQQVGRSTLQAVLAIWRESQARGWKRDWDSFRENREYTKSDL